MSELSDQQRVDLLHDLVTIESVSGNEAAAANFLVEQMRRLGYASHVDAAGNAVGIRQAGGPSNATIMLLGHIDTVPGEIPVRIENEILYGRGSVDAKGPLATMVLAGAQAALPNGIQLVVVGAVEEETATSRGARQIAGDYVADYCVIGEPSGASAITLGYKGSVLIDVRAAVDEGHTAGPTKNAAELVTAVWRRIIEHAENYNETRERLFDQLLPSLRSVNSSSDGLTSQAVARIGMRLPPDFDIHNYEHQLRNWSAGCQVGTAGYEPAWSCGRNNLLVRSLARSIAQAGMRPGYKLKTGTADLNVVGPVWNCPIVAYGPGDSLLDHTPREQLPLAEYLQAIEVLTGGLERLASEVANADEAAETDDGAARQQRPCRSGHPAA